MGWQVIGQENAKKDAGFSQTALIQEDDDFCVNFISERLLKRTRGREPRGGAEIAEEVPVLPPLQKGAGGNAAQFQFAIVEKRRGRQCPRIVKALPKRYTVRFLKKILTERHYA